MLDKQKSTDAVMDTLPTVRTSWTTRRSASVGAPEAFWRLCFFCGDYRTPKGSTVVGPRRLFCCAACKERRGY